MGTVECEAVRMPNSGEERMVRVYLPERYKTHPDQRFPVIYMMDGQNLFGSGELTRFGQSWRVDDTLERFESAGILDGVIVVGIDNAAEERFTEYSPWTNRSVCDSPLFGGRVSGGGGTQFSEFVARELKAWVDARYRSKQQARFTGVAGSSMGGLISLYIAARYSDVFSFAGIFSPALWFCREDMLAYLDSATFSQGQRYFLQVGTNEAHPNGIEDIEQRYIDGTLQIYAKLIEKGIPLQSLHLVVGAGDTHDELSWGRHFGGFVSLMFGDCRQ